MADDKMAGAANKQSYRSILAILSNKPEGAKISEIASALTTPIPIRTLLRRLSELKQQKLVLTRGQRNSTRYFIINREQLPLSKKAVLQRSYIAKPIRQRTPIAYQTDFLYQYQANKSFYLSKSTRDHLKKVGTPFENKLEPDIYVKRILHRLLIDLSWNSSRLEGNTYSILETERLIEFGASAEGKNAFETQMIINHKEAIEFMLTQLSEPEIKPFTIFNIHALLANNLLSNPKARGQLRQIPVGIGKTTYHPAEIPQVIKECFQHILLTASKIHDPFECAFYLAVQLPYLQPFEDVNKRVSRLSMNIPLLKQNVSPLSFTDVAKDDYISGLLAIYELNQVELMRDIFVWAYERSAQHYKVVQETLGEPNLISMRYKQEISLLVKEVVHNNIQGPAIIKKIEAWATAHIENTNLRAQFITLTEKEIASLHNGNIAVHRIQPDDFAHWQKKKKA